MHGTLTRCVFVTSALLAATTGAAALTATAPRAPSALTPWLVQAQSAEPRKTFSGKGIVTAVDPAGKLTINHETIEGLMPAMEMMFSLRPPALAKGVRPGDEVEFSVEGKTYTIVGLKVRGHSH